MVWSQRLPCCCSSISLLIQSASVCTFMTLSGVRNLSLLNLGSRAMERITVFGAVSETEVSLFHRCCSCSVAVSWKVCTGSDLKAAIWVDLYFSPSLRPEDSRKTLKGCGKLLDQAPLVWFQIHVPFAPLCDR